jgi:lipopolysaccharide transport system ATP-binding protein
VGDAYFQHKSFDRIRQFREQGTTLLIVSHDRAAIQSICDRAILLGSGKLLMAGEPEAVMDYYNALLADHQSQTVRQSVSADGKQGTVSGTFEAEITRVEIFNQKGVHADVVAVGEMIMVQVDVKVNADINGLVLGIGVKDRLGQIIFGTNTFHTKQRIASVLAGERLRFNVSFAANLGIGSYSIQCALVENDSHVENNYHWIDRAKVFEVVNIDKPSFAGCAWNELIFNIEHH